MYQIKKGIDFSIDPHQYAYKKSRCTADAILYVVHMALTHLENRDSYVRMHFLDFSSAFNTIIPQTLVHKLEALGLSPALCNWVLDFLTNRRQTVRIHSITSSPIILNTGSPQGCVLSPLLYSLLTYDCSAIFSRNIQEFQEYPCIMCYCMVWKLFCCRQEGSAAGGEIGAEDYWQQFSNY